MKNDIQKVLKESKTCEENSPARKQAMIDFIGEFVARNGQTKSAELLGISRTSLSGYLAGKKKVSEKHLVQIVEKILKK
ncbi:MAG: hypothetical protein HUU45_13320, partial [Leptospiraceae bacterium]|nr:hypothetical protein [Leptospiraceae bacterium]